MSAPLYQIRILIKSELKQRRLETLVNSVFLNMRLFVSFWVYCIFRIIIDVALCISKPSIKKIRSNVKEFSPFGPKMCAERCENTTTFCFFSNNHLSCSSEIYSAILYASQNNGKILAPLKDNCSHFYPENVTLKKRSSLCINEDTRSASTDYETQLLIACQNGDLCALYNIILSGLVNVSKVEDKLVETAVSHGQIGVVAFFVNHGYDIQELGEVLMKAIDNGQFRTVRKIIELGFDINTVGSEGRTILMRAALKGRVTIFKWLQCMGANMLAVCDTGNNVLHRAASSGSEALVEYILSWKIFDIDVRNKHGYTGVMLAVIQGNVKVVSYLKDRGCNITVTNKNKLNLLHMASIQGHVPVIKYLMKTKIFDLEARDIKSRTSLLLAAYKGKFNAFVYVLNLGGSIIARDNKNFNVLHCSCYSGYVFIVEHLFTWKDKFIKTAIKSRVEDGKTPLLVAAYRGNEDVLKFLVKGARINMTEETYSGSNIIHCCGMSGNANMTRFVLSLRKWNIFARNKFGSFPFMEAAEDGSVDVFKLLQPSKEKLSEVNRQGQNVLHLACKSGKIDMVRYLHKIRDDLLNSTDVQGTTPIMEAARHGQMHLVKYLNNTGSDTGVVDNGGQTLLHYACAGGDLDTAVYVKRLKGQNPERRNENGETPVDLARKKGYGRIIDMLTEG